MGQVGLPSKGPEPVRTAVQTYRATSVEGLRVLACLQVHRIVKLYSCSFSPVSCAELLRHDKLRIPPC